MAYTKDDFARIFTLPDDEVRQTLQACGISLKKRSYDESERSRFAEARELFANGTASSYDDIAAYFDEQAAEEDSISLDEAIRAEAISKGIELSVEQAETIKQVAARATIVRLKQMFMAGEFREELNAVWQEAFPKRGRVQVTTEEIEARLTDYQLSLSQPHPSLPPSSTESSDSD